MTTIELKKLLIDRIKKTEDASHLEAIKTMLDTKIVHGTIVLSEEQKAELKAVRKEVEEGKFYTEEEVDEKINAWLRAK